MTEINWYKIEEKARENLHELVFDSELKFSGQVETVAEEIFDNKNIKIIMVAGPSSSGKTTFANRLKDKLLHKGIMTHYIGLDDFFIDRDKLPKLPSGLLDFDSPEAIDIAFIQKTIDMVMRNETVHLPTFNFVTGKSIPNQIEIRPHKVDLIIIEGIHALNPLFNKEEYADRIYKIAIKPQKTFIMPSGTRLFPNELRLLRRTIRDINTRGYSYFDTANQWQEVCNAETKYITPYLENVDFSIDSAFEYELFLYKRCIKNSLDDCKLDAYQKIVQALSEITLLPNIEILEKSLLNEFAIQ